MDGRQRLALGAVGEDAERAAQRRREVLDPALGTEPHDELAGALEQQVEDRAAAALVSLPRARALVEDEQGPGGERLAVGVVLLGENTGRATTLTHTGSPAQGSR